MLLASAQAPSLCAGSSPNSAPGRPLPDAFLYSITSLHCLPATHNTPAFVSQANLRASGESEVTHILKSPGRPENAWSFTDSWTQARGELEELV